MTMPRGDEGHWTLDKRIPIAVVGALLLQLFGFLWWTAKLDSRVERLEVDQAAVSRKVNDGERDARGINDRLIRLEEKTQSILDILKNMTAIRRSKDLPEN